MAAKVGNLLMTSGVLGADPGTGELAEGPEAQARFCFENMRRILDQAGGALDDVVHVTVFVREHSYRQAVNVPWLELFPDENDRPARHTLKAELPGTMEVQLEFVALIEG